MKKQILLFIVLAVGIICTAELASLIVSVNPREASQQALYVFFFCLFFGSTAWLSLAWHTVKKYAIYKFAHPSFWSSIRQAGLICLIASLCLFFNSLGIFSFWDIIPLFISAILIEFFFQADKSALPPPSYGSE